jgi:hypothetical protein
MLKSWVAKHGQRYLYWWRLRRLLRLRHHSSLHLKHMPLSQKVQHTTMYDNVLIRSIKAKSFEGRESVIRS